MKNTLIAFAALLTSATLFTATAPSAFAAGGAAYRLVPASAAAASTVIAGETLWKCGDQACVAAQSTSRPAIVCAQAAKKIGKIDSFTFKGESLSEVELAKCNEKAR